MKILTRHTTQLLAYGMLAIGVSTLTSCKKDDESGAPAISSPACMVTKMTDEDGDTQTMEYDTKGRISKVVFTGTDYALLEYDTSGKPVKMLSYEDNEIEGTSVVEYNAKGQWTKVTYTRPGNTNPYITTAEYDGNGNRTKVTISGEVYTYEYSGGNLVKRINVYTSGSYTYTTTTTYEYYMDKENKLAVMEELMNIGYGGTASKNMLKKETDTYSSSSSSTTSTPVVTNYVYEYNDKGFPTKITNSSEGDINGDGLVNEDDMQIRSTTYAYQCK